MGTLKKSVKYMSLTIQTTVLSKPFFGYTKKLKLPSTGKKIKWSNIFRVKSKQFNSFHKEVVFELLRGYGVHGCNLGVIACLLGVIWVPS